MPPAHPPPGSRVSRASRVGTSRGRPHQRPQLGDRGHATVADPEAWSVDGQPSTTAGMWPTRCAGGGRARRGALRPGCARSRDVNVHGSCGDHNCRMGPPTRLSRTAIYTWTGAALSPADADAAAIRRAWPALAVPRDQGPVHCPPPPLRHRTRPARPSGPEPLPRRALGRLVVVAWRCRRGPLPRRSSWLRRDHTACGATEGVPTPRPAQGTWRVGPRRLT